MNELRRRLGSPRSLAVFAAPAAITLVVVLAAVRSGGDDDGTSPATTTTLQLSARGEDAAPTSGDRVAGGDPDASSTTTSTTTTTMPPRVEPIRLDPTASGLLDGRVIVVDPGHNGRNARYPEAFRPQPDGTPGPLCNTTGSSTNAGLSEMRIVWAIGEQLTGMLRTHGATVVLTHPDLRGFGPCADERGLAAAGADALIALHADGSAPGSSGFHVISAADKGPVAESARLAVNIRDQFLGIGGRPANYVGRDGVQQRDDLATLNSSPVQSVLIEFGNLRNDRDAWLLSERSADPIWAAAVARGLMAQLGLPAPYSMFADLNRDGFVDLLPDAQPLLVWPDESTTSSTTTSTTTSPTTSPTTSMVGPSTTSTQPSVPSSTTPTTTTSTSEPLQIE